MIGELLKIMYKVISKTGLPLNDCPTLDQAMAFAKTVNMFVTIVGPDFEVCGIFGVDTVKDPDYNGWISRKKGV
jgi:hypothetical protein